MPSSFTVLHVLGCLTVGGSEGQMYGLVRGLRAAGVRSLVGYLRLGTGELAAPLAALGAAPEEIALGGSLLRPSALLAIARLARRCRREGVHVIHAHDYAGNVVAVPAARLAGIPIVVSRRDLADWRPAKERHLLRAACRLADRVLVNATPIAELAAREGAPRERIRVVPNGIDVSGFDAATLAAPDPPLPPPTPDRTTIAVMGHMDRPHKGHADLLRAAARLRRPVTWWFLSDGPLRGALEAQAAELGISAHFLGRRSDVPAILARVDALVHPSWTEGFPNAVLEAMCAGLPVVATRVGGVPELLGDAGWLVPPRDPAALAAAIDELCADPAGARATGARARARVEACFSASRMLSDVLAIYAELAPDPLRAVWASARKRWGGLPGPAAGPG